MKRFKKVSLKLLVAASVLYVVACGYLYFQQENLIFHPDKLKVNSKFKFNIPFKEFKLVTSDKEALSALLFKCTLSRRSNKLIFFLHGNSGNLKELGKTAEFYTQLGYDFFAMDYRGFGKSTGKITSEEQFFSDIELVYKEMKKAYSEKDISIFGFSVGTGPAAMLASKNNPSRLVLFAPYFSMTDMALARYKIIPSFLLKYKFETNKYIAKTKAPITIFHGINDQTIPFHSSTRLSKILTSKDEFVPLKNQGHSGFEKNKKFISKINELLLSFKP